MHGKPGWTTSRAISHSSSPHAAPPSMRSTTSTSVDAVPRQGCGSCPASSSRSWSSLRGSALADADRLAVRASEKADRQLVWASSAALLLLIVIAIATVTSVTAPVRRLTEATRRLASGAVRTRVAARRGARARYAGRRLQPDGGAAAARAERSARLSARARNEGRRAHARAQSSRASRSADRHAESAAAVRAPGGGRSSARARATARVAVLFIDLDNFKTINDSLGHAFGDRVLQAVSERLRLNGLFSRSFSARLGGDEFTVVCEDVQSDRRGRAPVRAVLEEFQRSLSVHGRELRISVSVGASVYPDHADDPHALLRAADAALFRAKELGRNCFSLFAPQLLEAARRASSSNSRCVAQWSAASSSCSTSPRSASRRSRRTPSKRCCAGVSPTATSSRRPISSMWRSRPD